MVAKETLITESEMEAIAVALGEVGPFTEADFVRLLRWAERVRVDTILLNLILKREVGATIKGRTGVTLHDLQTCRDRAKAERAVTTAASAAQKA